MNYTKEELDTAPIPQGKIVFLGSNPSNSSPYLDPFTHCRSNKILMGWIDRFGLREDQVHFMNVANYKTPLNRTLKVSEVRSEVPRLCILLQNKVVVALGSTAGRAMEMVLDDCWRGSPTVLRMPHPSGRNRQCNDKQWLEATLKYVQYKLEMCMKLGNLN